MLNSQAQYFIKLQPLTAQQEKELACRYRDLGDKAALRTLVEHNMRFVFKMANKYRNRGAHIDDLIQVGAMGALEAAYKFDPDRGLKFITYAVHWIRCRIVQHLILQHPFGSLMQSKRARVLLKKSDEMMRITDEQDPDAKEDLLAKLSAETGLKVSSILEFGDIRASHTCSTDNLNLSDFVDTGDQIDLVRNIEVLRKGMRALTEREQHILLARADDVTLEKIGEEFKICRERIRQIQAKAVGKLRKTFAEAECQ